MNDLFKLIKTYRLTTALTDRLQLGETVFRQIEPELRFFVFGALPPPSGEDVLQDILKAIATDLTRFKGNSLKEFWAWCYRIARNKLADHFRSNASARLQPLPEEELRELVEATTASAPLSPADRHDLDYALKLLASAKPDCLEYLWNHYVVGLDYGEIAETEQLEYDTVRIRIRRCLDTAQSLVS